MLVQVNNSVGGGALVNAPVTFTVTSGGGQISATSGGTTSSSLTVTTDATGRAYVYYCQPPTGNITSALTASTSSQSVNFSETTSMTVATPTFSEASGQSTISFNVTVSDPTPGASIYYTLDGTAPTTSSTSITSGGNVLINKNETLKAKAFLSGYTASAVAKSVYQVVGATAEGLSHTIFLKTDGTVWTCGWNTNGQLGDGTTAEHHNPP
ncbi:MAG: chitobiase/beta-hexosaminidase C-terminal domain-containing protein [Candidatus Moraniibacteriota bacterium]